MGAKDIIELIVYVTPGFIARRIYDETYPSRKKSDFVETGQAVLTGAIISTIIQRIDLHYLHGFLGSAQKGFPSLRFMLALLAGGVLVGYLLVLTRHTCYCWSKKSRWLKWLAPDPQSIWAKVNDRDHNSSVVVYLDDEENVIYTGHIGAYTYDPNKDSHDFLLRDARRVNYDLSERYRVTGAGVYLNTKDIKRIEFVTPEPPPEDCETSIDTLVVESAQPQVQHEPAVAANDGNG